MRVLIACEFSGRVRDQFLIEGHDAWSCDLLPTEAPGPHLQCDVMDVINDGWDMMIAFPPCRYLCRSGARWWAGKQREQDMAIDFAYQLLIAPIRRKCLENPIGCLSTMIRRPDQIVQPWWFGDPETKATCLWLEGLPLLEPTSVVPGRWARVHREAPGPDRWRNRSRTPVGLAMAMATQWSRINGEVQAG